MNTITDYPLQGKTVLVRVDFNVPISKGKVTDNGKIKASLPTIKYLLQQDCKVVLATHLGRPEGKVVEKLRTTPLAKELKKLLPKINISKLDDCIGGELKKKIERAKKRKIFILENLRFYREEEENDAFFAHSLANLADIYVNDAFAVSHRKHASVVAVTKFLPSLPGLLVEKELLHLRQALNPERPAVWIMGGAKLHKIDLLLQALKKADYVLVGGALVFAFMRAKGISVGMSKTDRTSVAIASKILKKRNAGKIILAEDFVVAESLAARAKTKIVERISNKEIALDIGPKSVDKFKNYLQDAKTIVWNGPLGYFEKVEFAKATKEIGRFITKLPATTICGGGETAEAIKKFGLEHKVSHLSTGGGAALAFLSGAELPGITALKR